MSVQRVGGMGQTVIRSSSANPAPKWLPSVLHSAWPFMDWAASQFAKQLRDKEKRHQELLKSVVESRKKKG